MFDVLGRGSAQQGDGAWKSLGHEQMIPARRQIDEHTVLFVITAKDDFVTPIESEVTSHSEQPYIIGSHNLPFGKKVAQLFRKILVRQQAAACGRGITADAIPFSELHLHSTRSTADSQ